MEYLVKEADLRTLCTNIFCHLGINEQDAATTADLLVRADLRGVYSHGVYRVAEYAKRIRAGGVETAGNIEILRETPVTAALDAHYALGAVASMRAVQMAREKAKEKGMAFITVRNRNHFSMEAYGAMMLAQEDMIGFAASDSDPGMATFGGAAPRSGNNPFSCAFSGKTYKNICLDVACSMMAGGKKSRLIARGEQLPPDSFLDAQGRKTLDPALGVISLPFGGHKGSGLAFIIETLTSRLAGGVFGPGMGRFNGPPEERIKTSHCFGAIRIDAFQDLSDFQKGVDDYVDYLKSSPVQPGVTEIFYPGEMENRNETAYRANGIPLEGTVVDALIQECEKAGLSPDEYSFLKKV